MLKVRSVPPKLEQMGCLCDVRIASAVLEKNCWAFVQIGACVEDGGGIGWLRADNGGIILKLWKSNYQSTCVPAKLSKL